MKYTQPVGACPVCGVTLMDLYGRYIEGLTERHLYFHQLEKMAQEPPRVEVQYKPVLGTE